MAFAVKLFFDGDYNLSEVMITELAKNLKNDSKTKHYTLSEKDNYHYEVFPSDSLGNMTDETRRLGTPGISSKNNITNELFDLHNRYS